MERIQSLQMPLGFHVAAGFGLQGFQSTSHFLGLSGARVIPPIAVTAATLASWTPRVHGRGRT